MSTLGLDTTTVRPRRMFLWVAIIGGAAIAIAIALLFTGPFSSTATGSKTAIDTNLNQPLAGQGHVTPEPEPVAFVTSPVMDKDPQFFFGCGDGSNGYYAQQPAVDRKLDFVRYARMP